MKNIQISQLLFTGIVLLFTGIILLISCTEKKSFSEKEFALNELKYAAEQLSILKNKSLEENRIPRTVENGKILWSDELDYLDWTEGFFPGTCWYLFEATEDIAWKNTAEKLQALFENDKNLTMSHDLGFIFNASYGNAYRITQDKAFINVLAQASKSLIQRFNPRIGCIQSWNVSDGNWQSKRGWQFPVIIDNMMNLEMLFETTLVTGDSTYWKVAVSHANKTLANHFRSDNSSYHVVDYDTITGNIHVKQTAQGYAHESAWARGQGWALYGFTMCYRFTKDMRYLEQAHKIAEYILNNPNMPADLIPYWDFDAPEKEKQPRDVSAAAVYASALLELSTYGYPQYKNAAIKILKSLSSDAYKAKIGKNDGFLLMHSVGSIPHNNEIDVPLNYADYYYVEALMRLKK